MLTLKPVISIVLDSRRANKEKLYPVKLRATFKVDKRKWLQKYYSLDIALSKEDFQTATKGNPRSATLKEAAKKISAAKVKANKILEDHTFVTLEMFNRLFGTKGDGTTVGSVFKLIMEELKKDGRIGNYNMYKTTQNSIARFVDPELKKMTNRVGRKEVNLQISFFEINAEWLKRYVEWLRGQVSATTIAIYLTHLKAVYNRAIDLHIVKMDLYPFGRAGYKIKRTRARKIALSEDDKNKLLAFQGFRFAIDFWAFSFFSYGLNMADIALIRFKDIRGDVIDTPREKTINTDPSGKRLVIPLRPEAKEIITRRGNKSLNPDEFIFPILRKGFTPSQVKSHVSNFLNIINTDLKKVGNKLEFNFKLTFGTARHTFASIALEKGASLEFIQYAMGHQSMTTTQIYTSGFAITTKRAMGARIYD
jgi:integrase